MSKYYTYVDFTTEDCPRPFYVGKGDLKRIKKKERNKLHKNISAKYGCNRVIVFESDIEKEAFDKEKELIALHQTNIFKYVDAFGANFTDGGEGTSGMKLSEEHRKKIGEAGMGNKRSLGYKHPPEFGQQISERRKGKKHSEISIRKMSEKQKGKKLSPEAIAKREATRVANGTTNNGRKHSEESKIKMRKPKSKEHRNNMSLARKGQTWKIVDGKRVWSIKTNTKESNNETVESA